MAMVCTKKLLHPFTMNSFVEKSSHFFKVILPTTLAEKKLGIPEMFSKKFGDELSAVAKLIVPNGCIWQVGMIKDGRKIWFQDKWHDFVQYHSICAGYFLVFKYLKRSTFQVLIFDMTACEIYYPDNAEEPEDKISVHQDEMEYRTQSRAETSEFRPQNRKRKVEEMAAANEPNDDFLALLEEMGIYITEKHRILSKEEKEKAINIARSFKPKNPSFMVILRSGSLQDHNVNVPAKFVNKFLTRNARFIKLQISDGREWPVKIGGKQRRCFRLGNGWATFSDENNLKEGDICVFELMTMEVLDYNIVLKVSVFHATTS